MKTITGVTVKAFTQKLLSKLAAIIVALLLYGVIVVLNTPRNARAATDDATAPASAMALSDSLRHPAPHTVTN